ncbi:hypothetical protein ACSDR0_46775 [Streptosporangium sp. G11]|uniref:hypothetical protein n=1 Tax=Streptosporangium sp. G11 TaxID=3436926 RepID=UPI003EBD80EB
MRKAKKNKPATQGKEKSLASKRAFGWTESIAAAGVLVAAIATVPSFLGLDREGGETGAAPAEVASPAKNAQTVTEEAPVDVVAELNEFPICGAYLTNKKIADINIRPGPAGTHPYEDVAAWAKHEGAVYTNSNTIRVSIRGRTASPVFLTDMRINVLRREPPRDGTALYLGCGDPINVRHSAVDLDRSPPTLEHIPPDNPVERGKKWENTPIRFPYQVTDRKGEYFLIHAMAKRCTCTWTATLFWNALGKSGRTEITNGGKPFQIVAEGKVDRYTVHEVDGLNKVPEQDNQGGARQRQVGVSTHL